MHNILYLVDSFMVFYRKYRPQTISELDSSKLRETLTAVLSQKEIPHAFLLTGPKGLGKTSTARIIAKVINCEHKRKGIAPDNTCDQCVSITNGSNLDVLEIDGASNRGIDEIRDLRDKVRLSPNKAKKKIFIIDEVHMLTTEAFNALLKTIEEPPSHVMFIFCTTEPHKVPETIISRCFHIQLELATTSDIVHSLNRIIEKKEENFNIDPKSFSLIADLSNGSFRDSAKILEEMVILADGKKIDDEFINNHYQVHGMKLLARDLLLTLSKNDLKQSLEHINTAVRLGMDIKTFTGELLVCLHGIILEQNGIENNKFDIDSKIFTLEKIESLVSLFNKSYLDSKYSVIPQLPLELAVIEWCTVQKNPPVILNEVKDLDSSPLGQNDGKNSIDSLRAKEKNLKAQKVLKGTNETKGTEETKIKSKQEEFSDKDQSKQFMDNLIYKIKPINFSIAGVLRGCVISQLKDDKVIFTTSYKFHKEKLDNIKIKETIEKAIKEITGKPYSVMVELKS